jgi:amino acid permease
VVFRLQTVSILIKEQVEFVLSVMKITAVTGFIILAIIIDCGGKSSVFEEIDTFDANI